MKASAARDLDPIAIKHLEFLQVVINRLSQEMFVYKGWAVTLVAATFAVAAGSGNPLIVAIAMVPAFAFWGLGTMTLRDQRMYRAMYDAVRDGSADAFEGGPLSMDNDAYAEQIGPWWRGLFAASVALPYGLLVLLTWCVIAFSF